MAKKIYAELDRITFDKIKKSRSANGMIDENKFFRGLKEGDSVIFSCNQRKIEAVLKKVKKYNSITDYLKLNAHIGMMEVNSANPI
jgi:ASC-1-like (ASCH) protein